MSLPDDSDTGKVRRLPTADEHDTAWVDAHFPEAGPDQAADSGDAWPAPSDPLAVARHLVDADDLHRGGVLTVRWWRGGYYFWTGTHWVEVADAAVRARVYHALEHARYLKPNKDG